MELADRKAKFVKNFRGQIFRIERNIEELRYIFEDLKNNSNSIYRNIESSVEIVKIIKLLELERQVVEFNDILHEVLIATDFSAQESQINSPDSNDQENSSNGTTSSKQDSD